MPETSARSGFTVVIPARLASSRLPNKPLVDIAGLPMVVRVAQRALQSQAQHVVVAADDAQIVAACEAHGIAALLTRKDHLSGSDRLAEACQLLSLSPDTVVVNVQGDEPLIPADLINEVARVLTERPDASMSTAAHPIASLEEFTNPNVVKVVMDARQMALYFSRAPIPWWRDGQSPTGFKALPSPAPPASHRHLRLPGRFFGPVSAIAPRSRRKPRIVGTIARLVARSPHCCACGARSAWPRCRHA